MVCSSIDPPGVYLKNCLFSSLPLTTGWSFTRAPPVVWVISATVNFARTLMSVTPKGGTREPHSLAAHPPQLPQLGQRLGVGGLEVGVADVLAVRPGGRHVGADLAQLPELGPVGVEGGGRRERGHGGHSEGVRVT